MSDRQLNVNIVAADRQLWSGAAKMVVANTAEGQIGLLPGHEPLLAILAAGDVKVSLEEGSPIVASVGEGGFISMEHDTVTIVVREGQLAS